MYEHVMVETLPGTFNAIFFLGGGGGGGVTYTSGIWKVLSMVFYLSNRFTNPIMFGIILKSYLLSMLWHKFNKHFIMQTRKILL